MATVLFGVAGAGAELLITHGTRWQEGWAIGTIVGGLIDGQHQTPIGKINDLKYSGSSYGVVIPRVWGFSRVGGSVFWVANYLHNSVLVPSNTDGATHLVQHTKSSGGGGGSGGGAGKGGSQYTYTASFGVSFGEGSWLQEDGTIQTHNPIINRIWANDLLIYSAGVLDYRGNWNSGISYSINDEVSYDDGSGSGRLKYVCIVATTPGLDPVHYLGTNWALVSKKIGKFNIRFYDGSETQAPDPLVVTAEGGGDATKVPAMRGQVYIVIQSMDLTTDFGSAIPSFSAELVTDPVTVGQALSDIGNRSWNFGAYLDTSLATASLTGYQINSLGTAQDFFDAVTKLYALDTASANMKVSVMPRGGSVVTTIPYSQMGANKDGKWAPLALSTKLGVRAELPAWLNLTYSDVDMDYQQSTQTDFKATGQSANPISIQTDLVLHANEARQMVSREMDQTYLGSKPFNFSTTKAFSFVTTADPIDIFDHVGNEYRVRVLSAEYGQPGPTTLLVILDSPSALIHTVTGATSILAAANPVPASPCIFKAWSGTELRDVDQGYPGFYVATTWDANGRGGTIYYSTDGGSTWVADSTTFTRSIIGVSNTTLADASGGVYPYWDSSHSVQINLDNDGVASLGSVSTMNVLDGQNICVLGNEILGFTTATLIVDNWGTGGNKTVQLSTLYRGVRNSVFTGHSNGEMFVVADSSVQRVVLNSHTIGTTVQVKVLAPGQQLSDVTAQSITIATPTMNAAQSAQQSVSSVSASLTAHEAVIASAGALGHVKIGSGISVAGDGTISVGGGFTFMKYRSAWVSGTSYLPGDVTTNGGASYVCTVATSSTSTPGTLPANWDVI